MFPSALKIYAGQSLHFSNRIALFFSCSNADATTSALGMSRSAATEKHVDSKRGKITRTNLASTKKSVPPAVRWQAPSPSSFAPVRAATCFRYSAAHWARVYLICILIENELL